MLWILPQRWPKSFPSNQPNHSTVEDFSSQTRSKLSQHHCSPAHREGNGNARSCPRLDLTSANIRWQLMLAQEQFANSPRGVSMRELWRRRDMFR